MVVVDDVDSMGTSERFAAGVGDVLSVNVIRAGDSVDVFNAEEGVLANVLGVIVTVGIRNEPNDDVCAVVKVEGDCTICRIPADGDVVVVVKVLVFISDACPNTLDV